MKVEKIPLTGAMMDVTKVHFSLFFLSFVKGTVFFHSFKKRNSVVVFGATNMIEFIQYYFFFFFNLDNDEWRDSTVTKSAL